MPKKLNDSTWERDPDSALRVVTASINQDERHGYLNKWEAARLRKRAFKLWKKAKHG